VDLVVDADVDAVVDIDKGVAVGLLCPCDLVTRGILMLVVPEKFKTRDVGLGDRPGLFFVRPLKSLVVKALDRRPVLLVMSGELARQ